ncbi:MAG TPA: hypothetical protein VK027_03470 [Chitinophagaceae bacterium]|nr:hypothetical protein [Chitinophagaceae bacterium]
MKKIAFLISIFLLSIPYGLFACEVCEKNQPKVLQGVTHGAGPQGNIDYIITWSAVVIVGITLFYSLKFLIKPKEDNPEHIKNIVVE